MSAANTVIEETVRVKPANSRAHTFMLVLLPKKASLCRLRCVNPTPFNGADFATANMKLVYAVIATELPMAYRLKVWGWAAFGSGK
ncbi:MAG: hypothetical protein GKR90_10385 [Pseudomonadales bacterium]|nr:hypothetical protein [Pseudomonadales bacterium]